MSDQPNKPERDSGDPGLKRAKYRHYFRRLGADQPYALIEHGHGRFPTVDVYELLPIVQRGDDGVPLPPIEFFLFYGHQERDLLLDSSPMRIPRPHLGTPLELLLRDYAVEWEENDSLGDVVNDFLDAFFKLPGADEMGHRVSPWIEGARDRTIAELRRRDEWYDIRWLVRPQKLLVGRPIFQSSGEGEGLGPPVAPFVNVEHFSYNTLGIIAASNLGTEFISEHSGSVRREHINVMIVLGGEAFSRGEAGPD